MDLGFDSDTIEESYIGHKEEVIWKTLHEEINYHIYRLTMLISKAFMKDIRKKIIQMRFEKSLKEQMEEAEELRWTPEDIALVEAYFQANYGDDWRSIIDQRKE